MWGCTVRIIRKTISSDIPLLIEIYNQARLFMRDMGNPHQWDEGYPSEELLLSDIQNGESFVCIENDEIVGTFMLHIGHDPTYTKIEGHWLNEQPYGVIHRIASKKRIKGIASFCLQWCEQWTDNIRIDTHQDNLPMHNCLIKNGYQQCGIIYLEHGDPRVAYQKSLIS